MPGRDRICYVQVIAAAIALVLTSGPAAANMVLPLMFVHIFPGFIALLPVALVETQVARDYIKKVAASPHGDVQTAVIIANIASFVLGVAVVVLLTSWAEVIPHDARSSPMHLVIRAFLGWGGSQMAVVAAWTASVLPLFFVSWLVEAWIVARFAKLDRRTSIAAMLRANASSYGLLFMLGLSGVFMSSTG